MGGSCLRLRVSGGRAIGFVQRVACFVLGEPTSVAVVGLHALMRMAHMQNRCTFWYGDLLYYLKPHAIFVDRFGDKFPSLDVGVS